ncbi:MAG: fluoride efflux transporter FluC, partial [Paucilactobacillus nenjiangensis]
MIDDSAVYHQSAFLLQNFSKLTVFTIDANTSKLNVINTYESVITIKRYIAVFLFGIIGGGARYLMELLIVAPNGFPFSTLLINIIGCFFFSIMVDYI